MAASIRLEGAVTRLTAIALHGETCGTNQSHMTTEMTAIPRQCELFKPGKWKRLGL
jgi:hypothetical protein